MRLSHFFPILPILLLPACRDEPKAGLPATSAVEKTAVETSPQKENLLALSKNPFLKSHSKDLVQWRPWTKEAFEEANKQGLLVMVVIGYSSCPWTMKMTKETYNDPEAAAFINKSFIPILVDREEQTDINTALQRHTFLTSRRSGWPLHSWLTAEGKPVHSAIYMPATSMGNTPSAMTVLRHIEHNWKKDPDYVKKEANFQADTFLNHLKRISVGDEKSALELGTLDLAYDKLRSVYDPADGGFGAPPKFPFYGAGEFMLTYAQTCKTRKPQRRTDALAMLNATLKAMMDRSLQDHLGGGFFRYTLDRSWMVPQHEKMLYDQGLLALLYTDAFCLSGNKAYADTVRQTLAYVTAELSHPSGGFYTSEHGSSPSTIGGTDLLEGAYYIWQYEEVKSKLPADVWPVVESHFGLAPRGNTPIEVTPIALERFPNMNVLRVVNPLPEVATRLNISLDKAEELLAAGKKKLLEIRRNRPRPPRDEKLLPAWNGLMISGFARAGMIIGEQPWIARAIQGMDYSLKNFQSPNFARPRYLEDYVMLVRAALDLYEATGDAKWLTSAQQLQEKQNAELWDQTASGYFDGPEQPGLFFRTKSGDESSGFAPNAVATRNLTRLWRITGDKSHEERALGVLQAFAGAAAASSEQLPVEMVRGAPNAKLPVLPTPPGPSEHVRLLTAYQQFVEPSVTFVISGPADSPLAKKLAASYKPGANVLYAGSADAAAMVDKFVDAKQNLPADGTAAILLCKDFKFQSKLTDPAALAQALKDLY